MFVDDRPEYPMTFVVQFEFSGKIDRELFQDAVDQALERHPMLRASIQPAKSSRDCWVLPDSLECKVNWCGLEEKIPSDGSGVYLNLREENGFRCWVQHDDKKAILTSVFHHSCADGIGAYQFLGDVLLIYSRNFDSDCPDLVPLEETDLRKRLKANISPELIAESLKPIKEKLEHDEAQPLAPGPTSQSLNSHDVDFPGFQAHVFEKNEYRDLRLKAQENGQNVNDLLLEALLTALCRWNEMHGVDVSQKDFCILMPLDLRDADQPVFSATNVVTSSFIRRSAEQINNRAELSKSLREEVVKVKHSRHSSEFSRLLLQSPVNWDDAVKSYDNDKCLSTAVFSNAGDPTKRLLVELPRERGIVKCGNLVLEDLSGASPIRKHSRVVVNVFTYRRRLKICMRFDPQSFSSEGGKAFQAHFVECLT